VAAPDTQRTITVNAMWPNACVPGNPTIELDSVTNTLLFKVYVPLTFVACAQVLTPFQAQQTYTPSQGGVQRIMVLTNDSIDDGQSYPSNLRNKPFFAVNGGRDRLYPTATVEPFTRHLISTGVTIDYHPQPDGEHNTAWWPEVKDLFEKFVSGHPREPHPDTLTWTAAVNSEHNRAHWLVIDEWGKRNGEAVTLPDPNNVPRVGPLFANLKASGRVDLVRKGNTVETSTKGVTSFTLLLSPDVFDFAKPITVVVNGRTAFEGRVERSVKTLLKWAAVDNDRTMLYGAELKISVPNGR